VLMVLHSFDNCIFWHAVQVNAGMYDIVYFVDRCDLCIPIQWNLIVIGEITDATQSTVQ